MTSSLLLFFDIMEKRDDKGNELVPQDAHVIRNILDSAVRGTVGYEFYLIELMTMSKLKDKSPRALWKRFLLMC